MPTYRYHCDACGHELELFQSITEAPKRKCPSCGRSKLQRLIGAGAAVIFKGSGFYETDYRSESYRAAEKAGSGDSGAATKASPPSGEGTAKTEPSAPTSQAKSAPPKRAPKKSD